MEDAFPIEDDELPLGAKQRLTESYILDMELSTLATMYEFAVMDIADTAELAEISEHMEDLTDHIADRAEEELAEYGFDRDIEVRYVPELQGAKWAEDGVVEIGQSGRVDRPYCIGTEVTHEALHGLAEDERSVDEYTAREEGLMQTWNLHYEGHIESEDERTEYLEDMREVYNDSSLTPEGFGDEIHAYAERFVQLYEEAEGEPEERMVETIETGMDLL